MNNEFEKFIEQNREEFDSRVPDPAVLNRIQEQMRGADKKKAVVIPIRTVRWAAAACVLLIAGASIFVVMKNDTGTNTPAAIAANQPKDTPVTIQQTETVAIAAVEEKQPLIIHEAGQQKKAMSPIDEQLAIQKNTLFAKLNDMQSPGQRITATEEMYELKNTDKDIVDALVNSMNTDPNTNVRLAALEALSRFHREKYVKQQLVGSLKKQKDPIVQIELIQLLTKMKQTGILRELEKITNDGNTMKAVRDHAYAGIITLKS